MSKLTLVIIVTVGWWGIVAAPMATAAQPAVGSLTTNHSDGVGTAIRYFALAKKCTLRRYRRPH